MVTRIWKKAERWAKMKLLVAEWADPADRAQADRRVARVVARVARAVDKADPVDPVDPVAALEAQADRAVEVVARPVDQAAAASIQRIEMKRGARLCTPFFFSLDYQATTQ